MSETPDYTAAWAAALARHKARLAAGVIPLMCGVATKGKAKQDDTHEQEHDGDGD